MSDKLQKMQDVDKEWEDFKNKMLLSMKKRHNVTGKMKVLKSRRLTKYNGVTSWKYKFTHTTGATLWTGLCDCRGVPIYEGDLLTYLNMTFQIKIDFTHGLRFMFGEEQLTKEYALRGFCINWEYRLRLADGRYIYVICVPQLHGIDAAIFYDKRHNRPIPNWEKYNFIMNELKWLKERGGVA